MALLGPDVGDDHGGMNGFRDRIEAGRSLGHALERLRAVRPIVLGLPRGGVPVAWQVARILGAPLDVLVVRKLGVPGNPELGFGAVAEHGVRVVDEQMCRSLGFSPSAVGDVIERQEVELRRRVDLYRSGKPMIDVRGRCVVIVDDGMATGSTAAAAVAVARRMGADQVILAVPVGSKDAVAHMRELADDVHCLQSPYGFRAVGEFYDDFSQVGDEEVREFLRGPLRQEVSIPVPGPGAAIRLPGMLTIPREPQGVVVFAHGSGSSRLSPRNLKVSDALVFGGMATVLFDLLTTAEEPDRRMVFDIESLADRLVHAVDWAVEQPMIRGLSVGLFGASTGAAAALVAAAERPGRVGAVVSRGGRPDLAGDWLSRVVCPTLLIVGGHDLEVLRLNQAAAERLHCAHQLEVVVGATHLFEEPGALDQVSALAAEWFRSRLPSTARSTIDA